MDAGAHGGAEHYVTASPVTSAMSRIIDVTVPLSADVPTFPGDPRFQMEFSHRIADGKPYNVAKVTLGVHSGTHVDAPYHFLAEGATVEPAAPRDPDGQGAGGRQVTARDRIDLRGPRGARPDATRSGSLFKTRMSGQLRQPDSSRRTSSTSRRRRPTYLVKVGIKLVGIDYLSIEKFESKDFAAHHALLGAGVVIVEGLDLSEVDPGEYDLTCLPLRIVGRGRVARAGGAAEAGVSARPPAEPRSRQRRAFAVIRTETAEQAVAAGPGLPGRAASAPARDHAHRAGRARARCARLAAGAGRHGGRGLGRRSPPRWAARPRRRRALRGLAALRRRRAGRGQGARACSRRWAASRPPRP